MKTAQYNIIKYGTPYLRFESEVIISDQSDENNSIIIRSGYSDIEPTVQLAAHILNKLNDGISD